MNFIFAAILGVIAYFLFPVVGPGFSVGVLSIPFPELTSGNILRIAASVLFGILAIRLLFK